MNMKFYRRIDGGVSAFEVDGSQDKYIPKGAEEMTAEEVEVHLHPVIPLNLAVENSVEKTYADVDAIYAAAIGNRKTEYEEAEQAALAFQAAGYTGTASPYVADYAATAGITDQQSADLIIARANGLRAAVLSMRSTRFTSQSAMRAATTQAELDAAVAAWGVFIAQVRTSLGL